MIGFMTTSLSYTALADQEPEIRQKKSSANNANHKNNLQVQRKTTRQSNTKARKIEPSRQQRLDQARQKRRRSREQDPTDRFFDLRFKDLTDQQQSKLAEIRLNFTRDMIGKKAEVSIKKIDLKIEMRRTSLNRSVIEVIIKEVASLNASIRLREVAAMFDVLEILTDEQRVRYRRMLRRPLAVLDRKTFNVWSISILFN